MTSDVAAFRRMRENQARTRKNGGGGRFFSCLFLVLISVATIFGLLQYNNYQQFLEPASAEEKTIDFEVKPGESVESITARLVEAGVLHNTTVLSYPAYKVYLKLNPVNETGIQAGVHQIQLPATPKTVFEYLKSERCDEVRVTLREGLRLEEFAEELSTAFAGQEGAVFNKTEFISKTKNMNVEGQAFTTTFPTNLEGYLYPDTYNFCNDVTTEDVIYTLLRNFDTKISKGLNSELIANKRKIADIVNIAAMLEREARGLEEKKVIAGIILNRIDRGMPLGIDATTQYQYGYSQNQKTWWRKGVELDNVIDLDGPYNTRKRVGLPPTPIANPGVDAVRAVLEPTKSDYLYYITGNDGKMYYAKDLAGHNSNVCKYLGICM